jgi:hypothetical protein
MIKYIIENIGQAKGETENIRIAQGKYKLSTSLKDGFNELKREVLWRSK